MIRRFLGMPLLVMGCIACSSDDTSAASDTTGPATDSEAPAGDTGSPGDDTGTPSGDSETPGDDTGADAAHFAFGSDPQQALSAAPFPNDLYKTASGLALPAFGADPIVGGLGKPELWAFVDAIAPTRKGFGSGSPVWFFLDGAADLSTVTAHAVCLAGPEAGRPVTLRVLWSEAAQAVGAMPNWGDYFMPESTYAVWIDAGAKLAGGAALVQSPGFAEALDGHLATLGDHFETAGIDPSGVLVGTVFSTQPVLDFAKGVFAGVDTATLAPITDKVRWSEGAWVRGGLVTGEALEGYFGGAPTAPYEHNPGVWDGNRERAEAMSGAVYTGGTYHAEIGGVYNGSFVMPSFNLVAEGEAVAAKPLEWKDGKAVARAKVAVPFTLFLCNGQVENPTKLPLALFQHGGGAIRSDGISYANANCRVGIPTLMVDMVFHGGRRVTSWVAAEDVIAPTAPDTHNGYSGKSEGDEGYVPDYVSDAASAAAAVAPLFAVVEGAQPDIIEANLITISADNHMALRYAVEGDWSVVAPGLSFDATRLYHESLSFGTSFTTALVAATDQFRGVVGSVGSSYILGANMPMAPSNALQASAVLSVTIGSKLTVPQLQADSFQDLTLGMLAWLTERGDSHPYAPYVLRHRESDKLTPLLHSGNSWDETLYGPAQTTFANALGLATIRDGAPWTLDGTMPGSASIVATPDDGAAVENNVTFGGKTTTAAIYWQSRSCHAQVLSTLCAQRFVHPYPPVAVLPELIVYDSPICGLHGQVVEFLTSLEAGAPARIIAPTKTCAEVYGK